MSRCLLLLRTKIIITISPPVPVLAAIFTFLERVNVSAVREYLPAINRYIVYMCKGDADKKLDWTHLKGVGIRFAYLKGIAVALYGFANCNTVIPSMLNSLQVRRHHLDSPFPS